MGTSSPETEPQRLAAFYSGMTEGELQKIAAEADSLTGIAFQSLTAEMLRRGLAPPVLQPPGYDQLEPRALVTIRSFRDLPEAVLAQGLLDSSGIESFLADDNIVRMDWFYSNAVGGVKLQVDPQDVAPANQVLNQPVPEVFEVGGVGSYQQPRCPQCQSMDVAFEELNKPFSYGTAWAGFPIPVHRKSWNCHACRHRWEDMGP